MEQSNDTLKKRLTASLLKKQICTFLLSRDSCGTIGFEVMYGSSRRVADMVFISKGHSYAIEIKSEFDNTMRLKGQIEGYQTLFDYVLIFSAPNHLDRINSIIPEYVGLYTISESGINNIQREKINHRVQKSEMLISIPSATVKSDFSIKGKLTSDEIRAVVLRQSFKTIHEYFIRFYTAKLCMLSTRRKKEAHEHNPTHENYIIL